MPGPPPLAGIKVLEFAGLAPGPFAGMLLADAGASVLRIDRPRSNSSSPPPAADLLTRHKSSIAVDLKSPGGVALIRRLVAHADVLIDPFRPGVLESLSLGPAQLLALNPRLIYARLTGFRRDGRFAPQAGHDINYLAAAGVLALLGRRAGVAGVAAGGGGSPPTPPGNLLADFAGGGATLVLGVLLALLVRERNGGRGQVVEACMVDGARNLLDSGCPFYDVYETKDGGWMAVGALEERFFLELVRRLGIEGRGWEQGRRHDRRLWPALRRELEEVFKTKTRDEWERVFEGTDACCTPVYEFGEMRGDEQKGGDLRPPVTLRETPLLAVRKGASDVAHGQGPGVEGEGYVGYPLEPGQGGEETLREWCGWTRGEQFEVEAGGGLVLKDKAKL
ncbi:uncharacterized protein THITE_2084907 [Thermothielavioides terrestris NRRL 8126]|uniref:Uncharacterized protein n=1 Tax=Thermothielavioides terrestris (strain ATCC 38088 / NRRL 8126) TaxID=578455 RepID=G2QRP2_THETT|nr:uncharacterized protein THITE_2084907 [Thermothielavioides terrestris NRRL 8126]AEO63389.1 hypothetical protein THITE_2084907 [Thermothielavioides terrestris NRRL 8126]